MVHGSLRPVVLTAAQTLPPATVILLLACHHRGDEDHDHSDDYDDMIMLGDDENKVEGENEQPLAHTP